MNESWNEQKLKQLINNKVEESLTLEYKAADALTNSDSKKKEITKDVSAIANSAGGTIIYGISEYAEENKNYPEKIDPINLNNTRLTKEWLQQVINNIRPRIDVEIIPIYIESSENNVVYVVNIPQGSTAHQATDYRYYKRFNSISVPMEDYEIRDIMSRLKFPDIEISFSIAAHRYRNYSCLVLSAKNIGNVYAKYLGIQLKITKDIIIFENSNTLIALQANFYDISSIQKIASDNVYDVFYLTNTSRYLMSYGTSPANPPMYSQFQLHPVLPNLSYEWYLPYKKNLLDNEFAIAEWSAHADNASVKTGSINLKNLIK